MCIHQLCPHRDGRRNTHKTPQLLPFYLCRRLDIPKLIRQRRTAPKSRRKTIDTIIPRDRTLECRTLLWRSYVFLQRHIHGHGGKTSIEFDDFPLARRGLFPRHS